MICQTEILSLSSVILVKSVVRMMFLRVCCILCSVAILSVQHVRCFSVRVYKLNGIQENSYIKLIFQVQ